MTFGCEGQRLNFPGAEWERSGQEEEGIQQEERGCDGVRPSFLPLLVWPRVLLFFFFSFSFHAVFCRVPHCGSQINFQGVNLSLQSQSKAL